MVYRTYTLEDISKELGISVRTLRKYVNNRSLKAIKCGNKYIVSEDNFKKFVDGR